MEYNKITKAMVAFSLCLLLFLVVLAPTYGNQTKLSLFEEEDASEWAGEAVIYWNPKGNEQFPDLATGSNITIRGLTPETAVEHLDDAIKNAKKLSNQLGLAVSDVIIYAMNPVVITDGMVYTVKGDNISIVRWHEWDYDEDYIFIIEGGSLSLSNVVIRSEYETNEAEELGLLYMSSGILQLDAQVEVAGTFVLDYHLSLEDESNTYQAPKIELTKRFDFASDGYRLDLQIPEDYEADVTIIETLAANKLSVTEYTDTFVVINDLGERELVTEEQIQGIWHAEITEQTSRQTKKRLVARQIADSDSVFLNQLPQNGYAEDDFVNQPLGGNVLNDGDETKLVVMEADGNPDGGYYQAYPANENGLREALFGLYQKNQPSADYIMYFGANVENIPVALFNNTTTATSTSNVTFASLRGRVGTLVLTGHPEDLVTNEPAVSAPTETSLISIAYTSSPDERYFGCNIILRNLRYNFRATDSGTNGIYMNGYSITLGGNSWHIASTRFFSGASTGTVTPATGTAVMTIYSTGNGSSTFIGGMRTGTMKGNASTIIHGSSGNQISIWGGGLGTGTSTSATANITGSVTNTITGMNVDSGGLNRFIGGVEYGTVGGQITNTISGTGRFASVYGKFYGGSISGNIGSDATLGNAVDTSDLSTLADTDDYIIKNIVDFSEFTAGRTDYHGANFERGIVKGNIVNIVEAGAFNQGSLNFFAGGSVSTTIQGTWPNSFRVDTSTAKVSNITAGLAAVKSASGYQLYGNITNVILAGSIAVGNSSNGHTFHGAGKGGYIEGNVYSELGTEGLVYAGDRNSYTYSTTQNTQGYDSLLALAGGGGNERINHFCIKGDTTLVTRNVLASQTYGGNFSGVQIGDSLRIHHGGVVDLCSGTGRYPHIVVGDARIEIHGGQVDWALSGNALYYSSSNENSYQDGNISVEVFDKPNIIINGAVGGIANSTYTSTAVSGDSSIMIRGGDFSGSPRAGSFVNMVGFTAGALQTGNIYGDASLTFDLRGNQYGFSVAPGDTISVSRGFDSLASLGTNKDNRITLDIFTNDTQTDLLNGIHIYGDYIKSSNYIGNSKFEQIFINVNAPGSTIGNLYATSYANLYGGTLRKNVEINLVSVDVIEGLFAGNGTENITNAVAAASVQAGKQAVINVGPQSENPTDILGEWETEETTDGLPHQIQVSTGGIIGFTSMNIRNRLLIAAQGDIKNGAGVTVANHGTSYHQVGDLTLYAGEGMAGAGLGVTADNAAFIAGTTYVEGDGLVYIQSTGKADQIVLTDIIASGDSALEWMKVGNVSPDTNLETNWFGSNRGWRVITLSPDKMKAEERITPVNFRGFDVVAGDTFLGDSDTHFTGTNGYAVAIPGSVYTWEVTEGHGMITHNVPISTELPSSGQLIYAYGTVEAGVPSAKGSLAIPTVWIPDPIPYPQFSFIPDAARAEWVEGVDIYGSDRYTSGTPHNYYIDTGDMYQTKNWTASGDDKDFSFDIKARFAQGDAQVSARDVILTQTQAAAITSEDDIIAYTQAVGGPLFGSNITEELLEAIRTPLGEAQVWRSHPVSYFAGAEGLTETQAQLSVSVMVIKDEAEISTNQQYALYAESAVLSLEQAQAITNQTDLDSGYTSAMVIFANGMTAEPVIDEEALDKIRSATAETTPKNVSVRYSYCPENQAEMIEKNVIVYVEGPEEVEVTISKLVEGDYGDRTKGFLFQIYFWDNQDIPLPEGTEFIYLGDTIPESGAEAPANGTLTVDQEGKAEVVLKHGQQITMVGVPQGTIRIIEAFDRNYNVSFTSSIIANIVEGSDTGRVSLPGTGAAFDFINTRYLVVPAGVRTGSIPIQKMLLLLFVVLLSVTSGALLYYYRKRSVWHG